jgi:hypothetical protein
MIGAIVLLPHSSSWRGAPFKKAHGKLYLYIYLNNRLNKKAFKHVTQYRTSDFFTN